MNKQIQISCLNFWVKSNLTDLTSTIVCQPAERKKKIQKIRELTDFKEIFSVDILLNKRYNAPVISFKNFYILFRSIIFTYSYLWGVTQIHKHTQNTLLFTHGWRENMIHTISKGISTMWNANSFVQELNSGKRVPFLRQ